MLEQEGARPVSVDQESLDRAADSDIFLAIFGAEYSDLTAREYRKARERRRPCFVYVLGGVKRERRLSEFIEAEVKKVVKYQEFRSSADLVEFVRNDLTQFMGEVVRTGMNDWMKKGGTVAMKEEIIAKAPKADRSLSYQDVLSWKPTDSVDYDDMIRFEKEGEANRLISAGPQWIRILGALRSGENQSARQLTNATGIYGAVLWLRLRDMTLSGLLESDYASLRPMRAQYRISEFGAGVLLGWLGEARKREKHK